MGQGRSPATRGVPAASSFSGGRFRRRRAPGLELFDDFHAVAVEADDLARLPREQADLGEPEGAQDLGADAVVAEIHARGGAAARDYFAADARDNAPGAQDRRDGSPMPHKIRSIIAQGMTVAVLHRIEPVRGEAQLDVIDIFHLKDGRIARRERYLTWFDK